MNGLNYNQGSIEVDKFIENFYRDMYGKIVSYLTSKFGFDFLEASRDIAQDALLTALENWKKKGMPENPEAWLFYVAKNKAINFLKKENKKLNIDTNLKVSNEKEFGNLELESEINDSMLKMMFVCCSDHISSESQIVLILSSLCGFKRKEIASAFLCEEETIKKRLYRAKKKLRERKISFEIPEKKVLEEKLDIVCNVLYLLFNEGYNASSGDKLIRKDFCYESLRLTHILSENFREKQKIKALIALMYLQMSRFDSRLDKSESIVLFEQQDRHLWNQNLIRMGASKLAEASNGEDLSTYHLEAGIALEYCLSESYEEINWKRIKELHIRSYEVNPSPLTLLNIAIVEGVSGDPAEAIHQIKRIKKEYKKIAEYYLTHAALGDFYSKMREFETANEHYRTAMKLTSNEKERDLIKKKKFFKENVLKK